MKRRKISLLEWALLVIPLMGLAILTAQGPLSSWWNKSPMNRWSNSLPFGEKDNIEAIEFSNDSKSLAVIYWRDKAKTGRLDILDVATQNVKQTMPLTGYGRLMIWSPQNDRIVMVGSRGWAVWDLAQGQRVFRRAVPAGIYESITKWKSKDVLEVEYTIYNRAAKSSTVQGAILDIRDGILKPQGKAVTRSYSLRANLPRTPVDTSPDGQWALHLTPRNYIQRNPNSKAPYFYWNRIEGGRLELWSTKTGRKVRTFDGDLYESARFTDHKTITAYALASIDDSSRTPSVAVATFNINRSLGRMQLLEGGERSVRFSLDKRLAVTIGSGTLRLRDARTWQVLKTISGSEKDYINSYSLKFSPDGKYLAYNKNGSEINILSIADYSG